MRQYKRRCDVIVSDAAGAGLDLSALRIVFSIKKEDKETPNAATIRIYGVNAETVARIRKEFVDVIIQAGYEENYGLIFRGNIKDVSSGREAGTDTFVEIAAGDGDAGYAFGTINRSLAAGARQNDIVSAAAIAPPGFVPDLGGQRLPRGKVMYGMRRDYLRSAAQSTETTWSVQDGKMQFIPLTGLLPNQAVVLNSKSGLVGSPEQTVEGVQGQALLNPLMRIGGRLLIDEKAIQEAAAEQPDASKKNSEPVKLASDGLYRIIKVEHSGDTRGQEWYTKFTCIDVDASAPAGKKVKK